MSPTSTKASINDSSPDWTTFEEVSQTFKDLWDEVNGFRVDIGELQRENMDLREEVDELKSALESMESERDEAKSETERLSDLLERLEGVVSDLIERLEEGGL